MGTIHNFPLESLKYQKRHLHKRKQNICYILLKIAVLGIHGNTSFYSHLGVWRANPIDYSEGHDGK